MLMKPKAKKRRRVTLPPMELKEESPTCSVAGHRGSGAMVRTQIYLSRSEHEFVRAEARRRDEPMASVIRSFIDEKMTLSEEDWAANPLLQPPVEDPAYVARPDGAVNHDHYISGGPKKYKKIRGKWVTDGGLR